MSGPKKAEFICFMFTYGPKRSDRDEVNKEHKDLLDRWSTAVDNNDRNAKGMLNEEFKKLYKRIGLTAE